MLLCSVANCNSTGWLDRVLRRCSVGAISLRLRTPPLKGLSNRYASSRPDCARPHVISWRLFPRCSLVCRHAGLRSQPLPPSSAGRSCSQLRLDRWHSSRFQHHHFSARPPIAFSETTTLAWQTLFPDLSSPWNILANSLRLDLVPVDAEGLSGHRCRRKPVLDRTLPPGKRLQSLRCGRSQHDFVPGCLPFLGEEDRAQIRTHHQMGRGHHDRKSRGTGRCQRTACSAPEEGMSRKITTLMIQQQKCDTCIHGAY